MPESVLLLRYSPRIDREIICKGRRQASASNAVISSNVTLLFPGLLCIMKPTTVLVRLLILCATYTLQCIGAKPSPARPNSTATTTQFSTNETAAIYNRSTIETAGGFCDGGYCSVSLPAFPSHTRRITIPSIS